MAKKNNKQTQQLLSPEKYIRLKARSLPIDQCFISNNLYSDDLVEVIVSRRHAGGNYTFGIYLVDTFCTGVKQTFYKFNVSPSDFEDFVGNIISDGCLQVNYADVHNLVYGAAAYAEEWGIEPTKSFELTQYILDEDTDDIPLIEYEYGKGGRPFLIVDTSLEASKFIPLLEESTGGDYGLRVLEDEDYDEDDFDSYHKSMNYQETPYAYQHPEYPAELKLTHAELNCLFGSYDNFLLTTEDIEQILSLPRESLITDLQHLVLYQIGQNNGNAALTHALFFLGELRAEEALDTVLEVMRQDVDFMHINFGDLSSDDILGLTLYYVGRHKLPDLFAFAKEQGLYTHFKFIVFIAVNYIVDEPGRREEVLDWYRELLHFYCENTNDISLYSPGFGGLMIAELTDITPKELLPEIKSFFDTCEVDDDFGGGFQVVEDDVMAMQEPFRARKVMDIYERYQEYYES